MKFKKNTSGFTLVEILVAMVVLAIGLLGMAAMTVMVIRGGRSASDLTNATNICGQKLEELKDQQWTNLGNSTGSDSNDLVWGLMNGNVSRQPDLNSRGKTCADELTTGNETDCGAPKLGPYKYTRSFVVCKGDEQPYPTVNSASPTTTDDCAPGRSKWVTCQQEDITGNSGQGNPEKKIKVLCAWKSRDGQCHSVHLDTTAVQLGSN